MESMTDCAFSCPISVAVSVQLFILYRALSTYLDGWWAYVGNNRLRFSDGFGRCCALSARSSSRE